MSSSPTDITGLGDLDRKLDIILEELTKVRTDVQEIRNDVRHLSDHLKETVQPEINELQRSANRMDAHIDLVDGVYNKVKDPFFAVMDYAGSLLKSNAVECETVES